MPDKLSYSAAMKAYFKAEGKPVSFPKKGSAEHSAIRALMASGDVTGDSAVSAEVKVGGGEKAARKALPKKSKDAPAPKASASDKPIKPEGTTLIDEEHLNKKVVDGVVEAAEKKPVRKRKPKTVQSDGLTAQAQVLDQLTDKNAHIQVTPADFPGLKGQIEKVLDVKPEGVPEKPKKPSKAEMMKSKTTEGKRAPDMPAVEARAPFSFTSLRALLRN
jgi:hypothetical protein